MDSVRVQGHRHHSNTRSITTWGYTSDHHIKAFLHIVILDGSLIWIVAYLLPSQHTPARRYKRSGLGLISSEIAHSNVCPEGEEYKEDETF